MLKTLLRLIIVFGILTIITALVPEPFTSAIDNAFIYFLSTLWALNGIFNVSTFLICLQIFSNFLIGVMALYLTFSILEGND